jgi:solute:Na+ symporter, SSS family
MAVSALYVRNIYNFFKPDATETNLVTAGRWAIVVILSIGVVAAANMDDAFTQIQLLLTVQVPFGAAVFLMFFWRRLTRASVWVAVIVCAFVNILLPQVAQHMGDFKASPGWVVQGDESGVKTPVFWDRVVHSNPRDLTSPLEGAGRFHTELAILSTVGADVVSMDTSARYASRLFFDGVFPFLVLILVSLVTRPPERSRVDLFFGKMKTPVGQSPELDVAAMEETRLNPHRYDHVKLLGASSSWEFTKWDRTDTVGFLVCCCISGGIFLGFKMLLTSAAG